MTQSTRTARGSERSRLGTLSGYAAILGIAVVFMVVLGAVTSPPLPADAAETGGAVREQGASL
jgi:hypothetical protein